MAIPKILHQTVASKKELAPVFAENIAELKRLNAGWEYRLYDDQDVHDFIAGNFDPDILVSYRRINPLYGAARADFFRYLALFKVGGVYLDIKSTIRRRLDDVIDRDDAYLLSQWHNGKGEAYEGWGLWPGLGEGGEYQNWHIVAEPGHPFLEAVIKGVKRNIDNYNPVRDGVAKEGVLRLTGPIAYTMEIREFLKKHSCRYKRVDIEDLGFKYSILETSDDKNAHIKYFKNHYSLLDGPIVCAHIVDESGELKPYWRKFGRNDLCPCNSGKRYKHCHGKLV
jgi:hypothetical protein